MTDEQGPRVVSWAFSGPANQPVEAIDVTFSEPIDLASVGPYDAGVLDLENLDVNRLRSFGTGWDFDDVDLSGDFLFTGAWEDGLRIYDVSDVAAPRFVGSYDTPGESMAVQLVGDLVYVADRSGGLQILDVSDVTAPRYVGSFDSFGFCQDVEVLGNLAYTAAIDLEIVDVSEPSAPSFVGRYEAETGGVGWGVDVVGSLAYLADNDAGLRILDVSDPTVPTLLGTYETTEAAWEVEVVGSLAYVLWFWPGWLHIVDVSNAAAPVLVGSYDELLNPPHLQVVGGLAYVGDWSGLHILDVSDPASPTRVGFYDRLGGCYYNLEVAGGLVYLSDAGDSDGIDILRLSQPLRSISHLSGTTYRVELPETLYEGRYAVQIGPEITDLAGNPMDQNRDGINGESADDICYGEFAVVLRPEASPGGPYAVGEGATVTLDGSGSIGYPIVSYEWDLDYDGVSFDVDATGATATFDAAGLDGPISVNVALRVTDDDGATDTDTATVTVDNVAPTADAGGPYATDEGSDLTLSAAASTDPGNDIAVYVWDLNNDGTYDKAGQTELFHAVDDGSHTVVLEVRDHDGASDTEAFTVTVNNVAPRITSLVAEPPMPRRDEPFRVTIGFADPGTADAHTARIDWGDGTNETVDAAPAARSVVATHNYTVDDACPVTVTLEDDDGGSDTQGLSPRDELMIGFGHPGFWIVQNNAQWDKLHGVSPDGVVAADLDGNGLCELIVDFGAPGVWVWENNTRWFKLHAFDAEDVLAADLDGNGQDDAVIDFGWAGLWAWENNAQWRKLHGTSPEDAAAGDIDGDGRHELIFDYGAIGLWVWDRDRSPEWYQLHTISPEDIATADLDGNGQAELVVDFGSPGLWVWENGTRWYKLHGKGPDAAVAGDLDGNGQDELVVDFGDAGLWIWQNNTQWHKLHSTSPQDAVIGDLDGSGQDELIVDFGPPGLWVWENNTQWYKLHGISPECLATGNLDGLTLSPPPGGSATSAGQGVAGAASLGAAADPNFAAFQPAAACDAAFAELGTVSARPAARSAAPPAWTADLSWLDASALRAAQGRSSRIAASRHAAVEELLATL